MVIEEKVRRCFTYIYIYTSIVECNSVFDRAGQKHRRETSIWYESKLSNIRPLLMGLFSEVQIVPVKIVKHLN